MPARVTGVEVFMLYPFFAAALAATVLFGVFSSPEYPACLWQLPICFIATFAAALLVLVVFLSVSSLFVSKKKTPETQSKFYHSLAVFTIGVLVKLARAKVTVDGEELLPKDTKWLFVCNHRSNFDPLVTVWGLRRHTLAFIAKPGVFKIPVAGAIIHRDFYMPIDRENDRAALKTILSAANCIKNGLSSIGIYPEGTRSHDNKLLPFKNGALKIAQRAHAPLVIASIEGAENIFRRFPFRSTPVKIKILCVIDADSAAAENTTELGDKARDIILSELGQ